VEEAAVVAARPLGAEPEWAAARVVAWAEVVVVEEEVEAVAARPLGAESGWAAAWAEELVVEKAVAARLLSAAAAVGTRIAPEERWAGPSGAETPWLADSAKRFPLPAGSARTVEGS
jgi:hypothetical protein